MVKMLYIVSILCLMSAGLLFGLCGVQWLQGGPEDERIPGMPVSERLHLRQNLNGGNNAGPNPLLEQAEALALYLNPPKPPPRRETALPAVNRPSLTPSPAPRPLSPTPQYRILAISYYRSSPDKSLAMVWDAKKGGYWIKKGDRLGHFVVERIEKEAIFYRDGDQLRQMAIAIKQSVPLARLKSKESASIQEVAANRGLVSASP